MYRRLVGPQGRSGEVRKTSPQPGYDPRTVQPVASRYTDWATRPTYTGCTMIYYKIVPVTNFNKYLQYGTSICFGGLEAACWPLVPKFAGSNPAEAVEFLRAKKILSTPSFGGEVKPSVPCRSFAVCNRSLELRGSRILDEICRENFSPTKSSTFRC